MLRERDELPAAVRCHVADARAGRPGSLVLISGEAGAGETSLLREFAASTPADATPLRPGSCDPLSTLIRAAALTGGDLHRRNAGPPRSQNVLLRRFDQLVTIDARPAAQLHAATGRTRDRPA